MNGMQPSLFDRPTPAEAKAAAIERVEQNSQTFVDAAFSRLLVIAKRQRFLSSLDVWNVCGDLDQPRHPRAMGPVMLRAARGGLIIRTGRTVKSGRASDHDQALAIWESKIWDGLA